MGFTRRKYIIYFLIRTKENYTDMVAKTVSALITIILIFTVEKSFSQHNEIDFTSLTAWENPISGIISNNGRFVIYTQGSEEKGYTLFVETKEGDIKRNFDNVKKFPAPIISEDSRMLFFMATGDSLICYDIISGTLTSINNCLSFKQPEVSTNGWLAYLQSNNTLVVWNYYKENKITLSDVTNYSFSNLGNALIAECKYGTEAKETVLEYLDLINLKRNQVWKGIGDPRFLFDSHGQQVVIEGYTNGSDFMSISLFKATWNISRVIVNRELLEHGSGYSLEKYSAKFNNSGTKLFFNLVTEEELPAMRPTEVVVWHYNDPLLKTEELDVAKNNVNRMLFVLNLETNLFKKLADSLDEPFNFPNLNTGGDDNFLIVTSKGLKHKNQPSDSACVYLVNTDDGNREALENDSHSLGQFRFSPSGKYIVWYSSKSKSYFSYNVFSKLKKDITKNIPTPTFQHVNGSPNLFAAINSGEPPMWIENDEQVLIYDQHDIWVVDPDAIEIPLNLTNAYGIKNGIVFRYVNLEGNLRDNPPIKRDANIIICAFEEATRRNGFFKKKLGEVGDPEKLILSNNIFYFSEVRQPDFPTYLLKAKDENVFLLRKMSVSEFPNLVVTSDFKNFTQISNYGPERKFNWMTSELVSWKTFKGKSSQGILYKPTDFDPTKKYPLIVYIYARLSDGLNHYIFPELCKGQVNIPLFVSRNYLIFCPDIEYQEGKVGECVYDFVMSGVRMLKRKPYVDSTKLGIQGHSFGGYEVNYLVTKTKAFAAVASAAGASDYISYSGTPFMLGLKDSYQRVEQGQHRLGATLWGERERYISNSPIFFVDMIESPLLIMHNRMDGNVPWTQGLEFFLALRRLHKPAWMLEYENASHVLVKKSQAEDYTIRLLQFFDHYLKGKAPPVWMTQGVKVNDSAFEKGLTLDRSRRCYTTCKICPLDGTRL